MAFTIDSDENVNTGMRSIRDGGGAVIAWVMWDRLVSERGRAAAETLSADMLNGLNQAAGHRIALQPSEPSRQQIVLELGQLTSEDGPARLEEMIVQEATRRMLGEITKHGTPMYQAVAAISDQEIREAVRPAIEKAVLAGLQPTDTFGQPKGEPRSLYELIEERAAKYLSEPDPGDRSLRDRGQPRRTRIETFIDAAVREHVEKDLKDAMEEARQQVREAVKAKGAAIITETIERLAR